MLQKIENKTVRTLREFRGSEEYKNKYFIMIITKQVVEDGFSNEGYIIYTADSDDELDTVDASSYMADNISVCFFSGIDVHEPPTVGGFELHDN